MIKNIVVCIIFVCCTKLLMAQNNTSVKDSVDNTFTKVEIEAKFLGGQGAWNKFLSNNLQSDVPFKKGAPAGSYKVVIKFTVGKDGKIEDITPETNYGFGMEDEVMRVIKKGPKWIPASLNGVALRAYRKQPITFVVASK